MAIYVSHSRENSGAALRISDELASRGVQTWLDLRELGTGADWREKIELAMRDALGFIFLVGPDDSIDRQQRFEWQQVVDQELFLDSDKPLIPVQLGTAELPGFLSSRNTIQVSDSNIDYSSIADQIMRFIQSPADSIDPEKLERGRQARSKSLESLRQQAFSLKEESAKQAGLRAMK